MLVVLVLVVNGSEYGGSVVSLCSFGLVVKMVEVLSVLVVLVVLS